MFPVGASVVKAEDEVAAAGVLSERGAEDRCAWATVSACAHQLVVTGGEIIAPEGALTMDEAGR
jgi:hypothetical protein